MDDDRGGGIGTTASGLKVLARSMRDLERLTGRLATLGSITTSVVSSSPLPRRPLGPA